MLDHTLKTFESSGTWQSVGIPGVHGHAQLETVSAYKQGSRIVVRVSIIRWESRSLPFGIGIVSLQGPTDAPTPMTTQDDCCEKITPIVIR